MSLSTPAAPPVDLAVDRETSSSSSGEQAKKKQRVSPISKAEVDLLVGFIDATTRKSGATAQLQNKILIRGSSDGSLRTLYEAWQAFYPGTCVDEERFWEFATRRCFPPTSPAPEVQRVLRRQDGEGAWVRLYVHVSRRVRCSVPPQPAPAPAPERHV